MAESESASEVLPYRFGPVSVLNYSDNEDSTSESERYWKDILVVNILILERIGIGKIYSW